MDKEPEDKEIQLSTDYKNHRIDRERGYILSAAFFSFCAAQGLSKKEVIEMISSNYDQFLNDK